jgi:CRP-like cAMP-binding protein
MVTAIRTIGYKFKELSPGDLLGLEELILDDVDRCVQAIAVTECELDYIDKQQFYESKEINLIFHSVQRGRHQSCQRKLGPRLS